MVSLPDYDNNLFARGISDQDWASLLASGADLNNAISSVYPPGSTFKQITAAAGLQTGVINANTIIVDRGAVHVGGFRFGGWLASGLGPLNVVGALAFSSDPFFYTVAGGPTDEDPGFQGLGPNRLAYYADQFGFGSPTGIDLPNEASGVTPTPAWKQAMLGQPWYPGDSIQYGIGQSYLTVTPLQLVNAEVAIANGGTLLQPHVVMQILDANGKVVENLGPKVIRKVPVSQANLDLVKQGLLGAVNYRGATVYGLRVQDYPGGRQDGHCPVRQPGRERRAVLGGRMVRGLRPGRRPEIAVTVLIPGGGEGAYTAVPIAKQIFSYYFHISGQPATPKGP